MNVLVKVAITAAAIMGSSLAYAGEVEIIDVKARANAVGTYAFDVTLKHGDTGWEHYANAWDVVTPDGTVLGTRKLLHPHVDEQPFTRSLSAIKVPAGVTSVIIRAYDKVHGLSDKTFEVKLPRREAAVKSAPEIKKVVAPTKRKAAKRKKIRRGSY